MKRRRFASKPARTISCIRLMRKGDVVHRLNETRSEKVQCPVGMASGAACFTVSAGRRTLVIALPLSEEARREHGPTWPATTWKAARTAMASLSVPDARYQAIYEAAINTLIHLTAREVYPGPYTYRRFWCQPSARGSSADGRLSAGARAS